MQFGFDILQGLYAEFLESLVLLTPTVREVLVIGSSRSFENIQVRSNGCAKEEHNECGARDRLTRASFEPDLPPRFQYLVARN